MEERAFEVKSFEVKASDEFGTITGYAGVFDVLDRGNDILKRGALGKKSIKVPMMANHHEGVAQALTRHLFLGSRIIRFKPHPGNETIVIFASDWEPITDISYLVRGRFGGKLSTRMDVPM